MKQEWWSEEEASDFIRKSLRIEGVEVFVKRSGVRCTGFLQLSASENMAWIAAIYVRQGYRDQGIVSELVSMSKSWAAENGVEEIRLCSNSEKAEFWDANGFDTADFTSYEFRP